MASLKRNIVLSNKKSASGQIALLTLERLAQGNFATVKVFGIDCKNPHIAISANDTEIVNKKLNLASNTYTFELDFSVSLDQNFSCVLYDLDNDQFALLAWDINSENGYKNKVQSMVENSLKNKLIESKTTTQTQNNNSAKNSQKQLDLSEMFEIIDNQSLDEIIDQNLTPPQPEFFSTETKNIKQNLKEGEIFYDLVSGQIEDLFSKYPSEQNLENLIPNSKWVKVEFNDSESSNYVLGLIYDDINLKYICYGIPGEQSHNPPKDIEAYSQWLPLDPNNTSLGGYWVIYQDALTGENVQVEFM